MNHQYHLGLNLGHERSVAIVRDGKIEVAIEQERLDRNKFSLGYLLQSPGDPDRMQLPLEAIRYCLDACKIHLADLATITANMPGEDQAPQILHRSLPPEVCDRIQQIPTIILPTLIVPTPPLALKKLSFGSLMPPAAPRTIAPNPIVFTLVKFHHYPTAYRNCRSPSQWHGTLVFFTNTSLKKQLCDPSERSH